jgi:hypothetical protein
MGGPVEEEKWDDYMPHGKDQGKDIKFACTWRPATASSTQKAVPFILEVKVSALPRQGMRPGEQKPMVHLCLTPALRRALRPCPRHLDLVAERYEAEGDAKRAAIEKEWAQLYPEAAALDITPWTNPVEDAERTKEAQATRRAAEAERRRRESEARRSAQARRHAEWVTEKERLESEATRAGTNAVNHKQAVRTARQRHEEYTTYVEEKIRAMNDFAAKMNRGEKPGRSCALNVDFSSFFGKWFENADEKMNKDVESADLLARMQGIVRSAELKAEQLKQRMDKLEREAARAYAEYLEQQKKCGQHNAQEPATGAAGAAGNKDDSSGRSGSRSGDRENGGRGGDSGRKDGGSSNRSRPPPKQTSGTRTASPPSPEESTEDTIRKINAEINAEKRTKGCSVHVAALSLYV